MRLASLSEEHFIALDNFLGDAATVRADALSSTFVDWKGHDGQIYRRVCLREVPGLRAAIERELGPVHMFGQGYRLNYAGETPNQSIHSDLGWGTHAAVVYLCDGSGGTAFWRHKATGAQRIVVGQSELLEGIEGDFEDESAWEMVGLAGLAFNRGILYEGSRFHSRFPFEAFGSSPADGRLIAVAFFTPESTA